MCQTYENFEVIIVDDGSQDKSFHIAREIAKTDSRISVFQKENGGQASARNEGLKYAKGKYIIFIDSDDFIMSNMFELLYKNSKLFDADIIECNYVNWYGKESVKNNEFKVKIKEKKVFKGEDFYEYQPSLSPCDKLISHEFLKDCNFKCIEGHFAEDVYDISSLILRAQRIVYIDIPLYYYRRTNENSTRNLNDITRKIKIGCDKIFIANKLNDLKNELNTESKYVKTIIIRNLIGPFINKRMINKEYAFAIIDAYKENKGNSLLMQNMSFKLILDMFVILYKKVIIKTD
jgi:glycosyltransferase involved in cell wall biosynthesis